MMYKVGELTYFLSYQELKLDYHRFIEMTDDEFISSALEATHLACIISWFKELGQLSVADDGIVHQLVHLMQFPKECDLVQIRHRFNQILKLD